MRGGILLSDVMLALKFEIGPPDSPPSGRGPSFEARSTKQIRNPNFPMFKTKVLEPYIISFGHLNFENLKIVSDFDIRYSDFF